MNKPETEAERNARLDRAAEELNAKMVGFGVLGIIGCMVFFALLQLASVFCPGLIGGQLP